MLRDGTFELREWDDFRATDEPRLTTRGWWARESETCITLHDPEWNRWGPPAPAALGELCEIDPDACRLRGSPFASGSERLCSNGRRVVLGAGFMAPVDSYPAQRSAR